MKTRRRRRSDDHSDSHRWIISYADFITLLFAFFVVMYSISSVNISKYRSLTEGLKSAFNKKDQHRATRSTAQLNDGPEVRNTKGKYQDGMDELKKSLSELEEGSYKMNRKEGWIEMDIKAGSLFEPGTADIKTEALLKLMQLAGKVKHLPYSIVVEGYTDNTPIETPQYPSNWELSAARAASVGRVLNSFGIGTDRILVTGYGDQYPLADNATEEGRAENRRVNIIIIKDKSVSRLFNPQEDQVHHTFMSTDHSVESNQAPIKAAPKNDSSTKDKR